jgi:hypothetical protein
MRVLHFALEAECLEKPTRMHLAEIEAAMIWPDDPTTRARYQEAVLVHVSLVAANKGLLSPDELLSLANLAAQAARLSDLQDAAKDRYERGLFAGKILFDAVSQSKVGRDATLGPIMDAARRRYLGKAATKSKVVHNRIWKVFSDVAHLWAAHCFYQARGQAAFPCAVDRLPLFLAIGQHFRAIGERTRSNPKSPGTILPPGGGFCLAPNVATKLPKGKVIFEVVH